MPELDTKNVHVVNLEEDKDSGYKFAYLECELTNGEMKFLVEGLWTHQIIEINVLSANPDEAIDVQVLKKDKNSNSILINLHDLHYIK